MPKKKTQPSGSEDISITLTGPQVDAVRLAASRRNATVADLLLEGSDNAYAPDKGDAQDEPSKIVRERRKALNDAFRDPQLSRSLLRGLSILVAYGPDREWRAITELAATLEMASSTTHRYLKTLRAVGLMEQDPDTREYRPVRR